MSETPIYPFCNIQLHMHLHVAVVPMRIHRGNLELLMMRRPFRHHEEDRPTRFAGEYVFPGGSGKEDEDLVETAKREYYEETQWPGELHHFRYLGDNRRYLTEHKYAAAFFQGVLEGTEDHLFPYHGEAIDWMWGAPAKLQAHIQSSIFTEEQEKMFQEIGLDDIRHGAFRHSKRMLPRPHLYMLDQVAVHERVILETLTQT